MLPSRGRRGSRCLVKTEKEKRKSSRKGKSLHIPTIKLCHPREQVDVKSRSCSLKGTPTHNRGRQVNTNISALGVLCSDASCSLTFFPQSETIICRSESSHPHYCSSLALFLSGDSLTIQSRRSSPNLQARLPGAPHWLSTTPSLSRLTVKWQLRWKVTHSCFSSSFLPVAIIPFSQMFLRSRQYCTGTSL